jgi:hypothetical protein
VKRLKGLETSKQNTLKYANDLVLLAKEETVLWDMFDGQIEIGKFYGLEIMWKKLR